MAKDFHPYFSHDFGARNDKKMLRLRKKFRMRGVGIYWSLVEMLYEEGGKLEISDIDLIADDFKEKLEIVKAVVFEFDLFKFDANFFWSDSINERLSKRKEKSEKAAQSAAIRWGNAGDMRTHENRNAIKNRIEEDNKEKNKRKRINGNAVSDETGALFSPVKEWNKLCESVTGETDHLKIHKLIREFIRTNKPNFVEPYVESWNIFAKQLNLSAVQSITKPRQDKCKVRATEPFFEWDKILKSISQNPDYYENKNGWKVDFDFIFGNVQNYTKIIERLKPA